MVELRGADIQARLKDIDDYIRGEYLKEHPKKERDWRTYEQQFARRIYTAMKSLEPLIHEAVSTLHVEPRAGHPYSLTLEQRVKVLLIKQLVGESNRMFAGMLVVFSLLDDIDISYKTVERLYSDEEVDLALHNLHALILKGVTASDATGDGT
ncbi:MAG: ISNCY family transposase, partial [Nitrososphaerota archaeon]|nr:ISNCY family transposase [Nitrososphaerota archaeon]